MKIVILLFMLCPLIFANETVGKIAMIKIEDKSKTKISKIALESITTLFEEALLDKKYDLLTRNKEIEKQLEMEQNARSNDLPGLEAHIKNAIKLNGKSIFLGNIYKINNQIYIRIQIIGVNNEMHASETSPINSIRNIDKLLVTSMVKKLDYQINKEQIEDDVIAAQKRLDERVAAQKRLDERVAAQKRLDERVAAQKRLDEEQRIRQASKRTGYRSFYEDGYGAGFLIPGGGILGAGIVLLSTSIGVAVSYGDDFTPFGEPTPLYDSFGEKIGTMGTKGDYGTFEALFWAGIGCTVAGTIVMLCGLIETPYTYYVYEPMVEDLSFTPYIFPDMEGNMHYGVSFSYVF